MTETFCPVASLSASNEIQHKSEEKSLTNETNLVEYEQPMVLREKYEFIKKLGKGSQGQVWLAVRKNDGEKVAIKQLNIHSVTTWKQYELFRREAETLASINIPGTVPFYEYIEDLQNNPPFVCIVQKFIEGETLAGLLQRKHRFETEVIYDIIAQTLMILQGLHEHEPPVIHRDIKPSNIMLTSTSNGRYSVTLIDFGAVANPQVQNGGSTVAGTFGYMPPEQLMGQAFPASDIYALGAVAVQLLSGVSPADIDVCDFKLVIEPHLQHVPAEVVQTLNAMLEPAMAVRYCDHSALIAQFQDISEHKQGSILKLLRKNVIPRLEDVTSICQPGNYEIWQAYEPGKTVIKSENFKFKIESMSGKPIMGNPYLQYVYLFIGIALFYICAAKVFNTGIGVVLTAFVGGVGWQYLSYKIKRNREINRIVAEINQPLERNIVKKDAWKPVQQLLQEGQKYVGKIIHIAYMPTTPDRMYKLKDIYGDLIGIRGEPYFVVIYRFRYKYKDKEFEFHGELITRVSPENRYKVGDPITLIADLVSCNETSVMLRVMPFPFPIASVYKIEELMDVIFFDKKDLKLETQDDWLRSVYEKAQIAMNESNHDKVVNYLRQAISLGSMKAILELGEYLWFKKRDRVGAETIYLRVLGMGEAIGARKLGKMCEELGWIDNFKLWMNISYLMGDSEALNKLAELLLEEGKLTEVEKLCEDSIRMGNAASVIKLEEFYYYEFNEDYMNEKRQINVKIYSKEFVHKIAKEYLNVQTEIHLRNIDSVRSRKKFIDNGVLYWCKAANDKGIKGICKELGDVYLNMYVFSEAFAWYEKAVFEEEMSIERLLDVFIINLTDYERYQKVDSLIKQFDNILENKKSQYEISWIASTVKGFFEKLIFAHLKSEFVTVFGEWFCTELIERYDTSIKTRKQVIVGLRNEELDTYIVKTFYQIDKIELASHWYNKILDYREIDINIVLEFSDKWKEKGNIEKQLEWILKVKDEKYTAQTLQNMKFEEVFRIGEAIQAQDRKFAQQCYERAFRFVNLNNSSELALACSQGYSMDWLIDECEKKFVEGNILASKIIAMLYRQSGKRDIASIWEHINIVRDRFPNVLERFVQMYQRKNDKKNAIKWGVYAHRKGLETALPKLVQHLTVNTGMENKEEILNWCEFEFGMDGKALSIDFGQQCRMHHQQKDAANWLEIAYRKGDTESGHALLKMYVLELRDEAQAIKWYRKLHECEADVGKKTFEAIRRELVNRI